MSVKTPRIFATATSVFCERSNAVATAEIVCVEWEEGRGREAMWREREREGSVCECKRRGEKEKERKRE